MNIFNEDVKNWLSHVGWNNRGTIEDCFRGDSKYHMTYITGPDYRMTNIKKHIGYRGVNNIQQQILEDVIREFKV